MANEKDVCKCGHERFLHTDEVAGACMQKISSMGNGYFIYCDCMEFEPSSPAANPEVSEAYA